MCEAEVLLPIPDFLRDDVACLFRFEPGPEFAYDEMSRECFRIDRCIAPAVQALWAARIKTTGCCCGHGSGSGVIGLSTYRDARSIDMHPDPYRPTDSVRWRRLRAETPEEHAQRLHLARVEATTQQDDDGLWFEAQTGLEDRLQEALRRLYAALEPA